MKKLKLFICTSIMAILALTGCRKDSATKQLVESTEQKQVEETAIIKQKFYNLSSEQTTAQVKKFKSISGSQLNVYVPTDSAQWILEAALNFDFDSVNIQKSEIIRDSIIISIEIENNNINFNDLKLAYQNLYNQISRKTGQTKSVYLIDISAFQKNLNSIGLKANLITFVSQINQKTSTITSNAIWSTTEPFFNSFCGTPSGPDAASQVQAELDLNIPHGTRSCYWTNLGTYSYNNYNGAYSSYLFYFSTTNSSNICTNPAITLSAAQQNSYVSSAYGLATSVLYLGQPDFADFQISPVMQAPVIMGDPYRLYWNMSFTKGQFNC